MAVHRPLSGLAWFLIAAAGLFMLRPDLFPDLKPPGGGDQRVMLGMLLVLVAAAVAIAAAIEALSHRDKPRRAPSYAGPMLGVDPQPQAASTPPGPALEAAVSTESPPERVWAPLPPPRLVAVASAPEPVAEPRSEPAPVVIGAGTGEDAIAAALQAGDAAHAEGRSEAAVEHYSAAVDAARTFLAGHADDPAAKAGLAGALSKLAGQEEADGAVEPAIKLYEEAAELRRNLAAESPSDAEAADALAAALAQLADCREARGHASRARDLYAEAVKIRERLSWLEPASEPHRAALDEAKTRLEALKQELSPSEAS